VKTKQTQRIINAPKESACGTSEPAGVPTAPAGFEHCWDKFSDGNRLFVTKALSVGKHIVAGTISTKEMLDFMLSVPAELRAELAPTPQGAIFQSSHFADIEWVHAAFYGPRTPTNSRSAALLKVVGKPLRIDIEALFAHVIAAMFNLGKHYETEMPVRPESKETYDTWLRLLAAIGELRSTVPPLFAERCHLAKVERDSQFTRRSNRAFAGCPDSSPVDLLAHLGVSQLRQALVQWWDVIHSYQPRFGLADFTYKAVGQFCGLVFDPQGKRKGDPFDGDKVREAVRSLRLVKRPWAITDLAVEGGQVILTFKTGQRVPFTRRTSDSGGVSGGGET
jgi:hypothetical protein